MKTFDKKNVLTSLKGPDEDKIECAVIGRFIPPILLSRLSTFRQCMPEYNPCIFYSVHFAKYLLDL